MKKWIAAAGLAASLVTVSASVIGCVVVAEEPPRTCVTGIAKLQIKNLSGLDVHVDVIGRTNVVYDLTAFGTFSFQEASLLAGSYRVVASYYNGTKLLYDRTSFFACEETYLLELEPPSNPPGPPPGYAELDLDNSTGETMVVFVDGAREPDLVRPGEVAAYYLPQGYHTLVVQQYDAPDVYLINQRDYWADGSVAYWTLESDYPLVELQNNLPLRDECVEADLDRASVLFDTGHYEVCPAEVGYLTVPHESESATHTVDVFGQKTGYQFDSVRGHFPENTVTVIDISL